ncbi:MAG: putative molybdenum carrier protein [Pseudomonadota bacterium]
MITKVISGGQTGADQAALDIAIKLDIPHGGWVPKGRLTEDGPLPEKYGMQETGSTSYPERTERNVADSDGTLIFSHGELSGGSRLTQELTGKHARPCLHINLNTISAFHAAQKIKSWTIENQIEVLNVAGSRASGDPDIYQAVVDILEAFFYLDMMGDIPFESDGKAYDQDIRQRIGSHPKTLQEAVNRLAENMALKDRVTVANMTEREVEALFPRLEKYIRVHFGLISGNEDLIRSCIHELNDRNPNERDAIAVMIRELWKMLRNTHRLKIVK